MEKGMHCTSIRHMPHHIEPCHSKAFAIGCNSEDTAPQSGREAEDSIGLPGSHLNLMSSDIPPALYALAERQGHKGRWCPEESASYLSWLTFSFVSSLVAEGSRKALQQEDLWDLPHGEEAAKQCSSFNQALQATVNPARAPQVHTFISRHWHVHENSMLPSWRPDAHFDSLLLTLTKLADTLDALLQIKCVGSSQCLLSHQLYIIALHAGRDPYDCGIACLNATIPKPADVLPICVNARVTGLAVWRNPQNLMQFASAQRPSCVPSSAGHALG